jgi:GNAT superfamily N-acetyltransferase
VIATKAPNRSEAKARERGGASERNTFKLPQGEPIRRELVRVFRDQRRQVLGALRGGRKDEGEPTVDTLIFPPFRLGALAMSERMTPHIEALWDQAGQRFLARIEEDPDQWQVTNPHLAGKIERAALDFCEATNRTTSLELDEALRRTREELHAGLVTEGESLAKLTKRVNAIFDGAETWRARRIAASEASRAVHAAQEQAAIQSGVVAGWEWLLSSDACPLCQTVARRAPRVKLGQPFAVVGDHPVYSEVRHPPLHPGCQCSMVEVLDTDEPPASFAPTLHQPEPEPQDLPPPEFGPSKARVVTTGGEDETRQAVRSVLGRRARLSDVASAVGAPDDATVTIKVRGDRLEVAMDDPQERYLAYRTIERDGDGRIVIRNDAILVLPEYQGQGIGAAIFGRQVEQASRLKVDRIEARAERSPRHVGYHVWPKLGFDGPIPPKLINRLPAELAGARRLSDLMATRAGRDWWRAHGDTVNVAFDLAPGSTSRQLLDAYLRETRSRAKGSSAGLERKTVSPDAEEPDLAPGDDAVLDAVCDRILGEKDQ